jgi:hypothetical protein
MADEINDAAGNENSAGSNENTGSAFVLDDATIDRIAEASSRKAAEHYRQNPGSNDAGSNDAGSNNSGSSNGGSNDILTAIQALPETVARAVKEAIGTPKPIDAGGNNGGNGAESNDGKSGSSEPGKKRTFAEWWTG